MAHSGTQHDLLELTCGAARVLLAPTIGGAIAAFCEAGSGGVVHWLRPASAAALAGGDPLGMASFPLLPFCNRIRDGHFEWEGLSAALPPNDQGSPHVLHGLGWQRPWNVAQADSCTATLTLECAAGDWPFPFRAVQHFRLDAHGLHVHLSATNSGAHSMPLGLGHHPYFPYEDGVTITAAVRQIWNSDDEAMPTGLDSRHGAIGSLTRGMLVRRFALDNNFIGWTRRITVAWPGRSLTLLAETPLDYLVLYTPPDQDYFCIEPVSNCTDWINLRHHYRPDQLGGAIVAPGATLDGRFSLLTNLSG